MGKLWKVNQGLTQRITIISIKCIITLIFTSIYFILHTPRQQCNSTYVILSQHYISCQHSIPLQLYHNIDLRQHYMDTLYIAGNNVVLYQFTSQGINYVITYVIIFHTWITSKRFEVYNLIFVFYRSKKYL